jgi:hypothetical protein
MKNAASRPVATVALFLSVASHAQTTADTAPVGVAPQDLLDLAATVKAQKEIIEAQRAMLATQVGANVTLPAGTTERVDNVILPSAARFAAYDATAQIGQAICDDLKGSGTLIYSPDNYRAMREQRLAIEGQLDHLLNRIAEASKVLGDAITPKAQPEITPSLFLPGAAAALLALDAVGAVGKAIAGLAGFFKTDRKIGSVESVVDEATVALAIRSCRENKVTLSNPSDFTLSEVKVPKVEDLRGKADKLRDLISRAGGRLAEKKSAALKATQDLAQAEEDDKPGKTTALKTAEEEVAGIEAPLRIATVTLAAADTALDKLHAVAEGSGVSPIVVLARMYKIIVDDDAKILNLRVLHSSGSSQISRAWWRNDRLYFGGGVAVSYVVSTLKGDVTNHNVYYYQTPWKRLQEEEGTAVIGLRAFTSGGQK